MYDDSRFATDFEFDNNLQKQKPDVQYQQSGIVLKYENGCAYTDISDNHTLIFGNTGSKKTRNFCIPTVYSIAQSEESMLISDPKGEIYHNTSGFLKKQGYNIRVVNIREPKKGHFWNPLEIAYFDYKNGQKNKAIEMITDLSVQLQNQIHSERDPYWEMIASDLFVGITLALFEAADSVKEVNFLSIQKIRESIKIYEASDEKTHLFWTFAEQFKDNDMIMKRLESTVALKSVERTLSCVLSTFDALFQNIIINFDIVELTSVSDFSYDELYQQKTALFLITPDEKRTYHFLVSIFIKQCYEYLIRKAQQIGGMLPIRINYILDEFSNLAKITDMPSIISAGRSRNIRFTLVVQSSQQLYSIYKEDADTIKSNCQNWIFLASRETKLLKEISELCGQFYIENRGYRPLLNISALQTLTTGYEDSQALIIKNHCYPYISWMKDFSYYPQSGFSPAELPVRKSNNYRKFSIEDFLKQKIKQTVYDDEDFIDSLDALFN